MGKFFDALNCLVVFFFLSGGFLNVVSKFLMIRDAHVFFALLVSFSSASFSFDVSESLSEYRNRKYLWSLLNYLCSKMFLLLSFRIL